MNRRPPQPLGKLRSALRGSLGFTPKPHGPSGSFGKILIGDLRAAMRTRDNSLRIQIRSGKAATVARGRECQVRAVPTVLSLGGPR
jgi:hypothetical protein